MEKILRGFLSLCLVGMCASPGVGFAEVSEVAALKAQITDLTGKLEQLQGVVKTIQEGQSKAPTYISSPSSESGGLLRAVEDINISGYVDTQYSMGLTNSTDHRTSTGVRNAATNTGRVFDRNQDSFTLNAVELDFEKKANPEGGAGFRFDIMYGEDADVVDFDATTSAATGTPKNFDLQQGYVEYVQPLGFWETSNILPKSVDFKVGRFVTLAGTEVIESKDNWNISRGFAFGYAVPFTHTGLRSNFKMFNDKLDLYAGVNNGWDYRVDNNKFKTMEFGGGYTLFEKLGVFHSIYYGPEENDTTSHKRFLSSNVLSYDITERLQTKAEFTFGNENRMPTQSYENVDWQAYAGYLRYKLTDKWAAAYRAELFKQTKLSRLALDPTLLENTFTLEYRLSSNLLSRVEYRFDKANANPAFDLHSQNQTLGAQLIYSFA